MKKLHIKIIKVIPGTIKIIQIIIKKIQIIAKTNQEIITIIQITMITIQIVNIRKIIRKDKIIKMKVNMKKIINTTMIQIIKIIKIQTKDNMKRVQKVNMMI